MKGRVRAAIQNYKWNKQNNSTNGQIRGVFFLLLFFVSIYIVWTYLHVTLSRCKSCLAGIDKLDFNLRIQRKHTSARCHPKTTAKLAVTWTTVLQDKHHILGKQFIHPGEIVEAHNFKHSLLKNVLIKHNYLLFSTFPSFLQDKATHFYTNGSPYKKVLQVGVGNLDKKYYYYLFNHNLKRHIFFCILKCSVYLKKL